MIKIIIKIFSLLHPIKNDYAIKHSSSLRNLSESRIDGWKADLNGCTDKWFLMAHNSLDDCIPKDNLLDSNVLDSKVVDDV
jgi:hypothetical protein